MANALNRLTLCKRLARWSGWVRPSEITTTTGTLPDKVEDIVEFIDQAHIDIQTMRNDWLWMRRSSRDAQALTASNRRIQVNLLDAQAERIVPFIAHDTYPEQYILLKHPTTGVVGKCHMVPYEIWRGYRDRGNRPEGRPTRFTHLPLGDAGTPAATRYIEFDPTPDVAYTINCDYKEKPGEMASDLMNPEPMPFEFHMIIVWYAMVHLMDFDERSGRLRQAEKFYNRMFNRLVIDQTPPADVREFMTSDSVYNW